MAKTIIGGTVTVAFEAFFGGHLLEFLKIAKQTSPNKTYLDLFRGMTQQKGLAGILDGFLPWYVDAPVDVDDGDNGNVPSNVPGSFVCTPCSLLFSFFFMSPRITLTILVSCSCWVCMLCDAFVVCVVCLFVIVHVVLVRFLAGAPCKV